MSVQLNSVFCLLFLFFFLFFFQSLESCFLFSPPLCLFQGYPQALLPLTVAGIPSIHICLDFIPELLAQPQLEKQVKPPVLPLALIP